MNTQLVDSIAKRLVSRIVQMVGTLPPAERELVKQKLSILSDREWSNSKTELTLEDRRAFLRKPLAERQLILAQQAQEIVEHYQTSTEWRELMAGDIIEPTTFCTSE
jgi:hypothetical protein